MGRQRYIAVEGPIGVGKTTLVRILAERFGFETVFEQVEDNPFLPKYYKDPKRWAFSTQLNFLLSRFQQQRDLAQGDLFAKGIVADYLFAKDEIFAAMTLQPEELDLYYRVYELLKIRVAVPDLVVYLRARPEILLSRIKRRAIVYERAIGSDYLEALTQAYDKYFFHYAETPLLVVETSEIDILDREGDLEGLVNEVERMESGRQHYIPLGS
ncbi:MAG: deoxynucleoside kinase [Myxococcales bacterium]|nr:deoxynucleoside kinase [Myxococcales bacterium]